MQNAEVYCGCLSLQEIQQLLWIFLKSKTSFICLLGDPEKGEHRGHLLVKQDGCESC